MSVSKLVWRITFAVVTIVGAYSIWFNLIVDTKMGGPESWGQFGDYFGGILNPVLSALALVILAISLKATVKALQQNEKILELTRLELEKTTKQIEQNNIALSEQIKVVQSNAHVERLGTYADKIHQELLEIRDKEPPDTMQLLRKEVGHYISYGVFASFDSQNSNFYNMRSAEEWTLHLNSWETEILHTELLRVIRLFQALIKTCILAQSISGTNEMITYYGGRMGKWMLGAVMLGYIDEKDFDPFLETFDSVPNSRF